MNRIMNDGSHRGSKGAIFGIIMVLVGFIIIANQLDIIPFKMRELLWH